MRNVGAMRKPGSMHTLVIYPLVRQGLTMATELTRALRSL